MNAPFIKSLCYAIAAGVASPLLCMPPPLPARLFFGHMAIGGAVGAAVWLSAVHLIIAAKSEPGG